VLFKSGPKIIGTVLHFWSVGYYHCSDGIYFTVQTAQPYRCYSCWFYIQL